MNVTRKIQNCLSPAAAREVVRQYGVWVRTPITPSTIGRASEMSEIWRLSFWDGMILAAAEESGAAEVLTEDLNHGQRFAGIRVVNPFRP